MPRFGAQHANELILIKHENCKTYAKLYVCHISKQFSHQVAWFKYHHDFNLEIWFFSSKSGKIGRWPKSLLSSFKVLNFVSGLLGMLSLLLNTTSLAYSIESSNWFIRKSRLRKCRASEIRPQNQRKLMKEADNNETIECLDVFSHQLDFVDMNALKIRWIVSKVTVTVNLSQRGSIMLMYTLVFIRFDPNL